MLAAAGRLKTMSMPLMGAVVGGLIMGPIGLAAGAKMGMAIGGTVGIVSGAAGGVGAKRLAKHNLSKLEANVVPGK